MRALRAQHVFDGDGFRDGGATVIMDGAVVRGLEPYGFPLPDGCDIVDVGAATVLPGLIDTHVHLVGDSGFCALERLPAYSYDELDQVVTTSLAAQLAAGVTTVRDLGDRDYIVVDRRHAPRPGPEPFVVASGPPITTVGGHCHQMGGAVTGPDEIAAAVRDRVDRGADLVKIMAGGGFLTPGTDVFGAQFTGDELRLAADEAHRHGLPITAHAHSLDAVRLAVAAGVDGIEHATCLTAHGLDAPEQLLDDMAARAMWVCMTVGADLSRAEGADVSPLAKLLMAKYGWTHQEVVSARLAVLDRMRRHGVRVVVGVDAGIAPPKAHGVLSFAIGDHVEAGFSVTQALAAATSGAAEALQLGMRKGRLAPGYDADLIVVEGDLSDTVDALRAVRSVYLAGERVS